MGSMRYYKTVSNGYICHISVNSGGTEITEAEYNTILAAIRSKPAATETTDYRLREDLTWEAYEIEPPDPEEDELTDEEALEILLGGAT